MIMKIFNLIIPWYIGCQVSYSVPFNRLLPIHEIGLTGVVNLVFCKSALIHASKSDALRPYVPVPGKSLLRPCADHRSLTLLGSSMTSPAKRAKSSTPKKGPATQSSERSFPSSPHSNLSLVQAVAVSPSLTHGASQSATVHNL